MPVPSDRYQYSSSLRCFVIVADRITRSEDCLVVSGCFRRALPAGIRRTRFEQFNIPSACAGDSAMKISQESPAFIALVQARHDLIAASHEAS